MPSILAPTPKRTGPLLSILPPCGLEALQRPAIERPASCPPIERPNLCTQSSRLRSNGPGLRPRSQRHFGRQQPTRPRLAPAIERPASCPRSWPRARRRAVRPFDHDPHASGYAPRLAPRDRASELMLSIKRPLPFTPRPPRHTRHASLYYPCKRPEMPRYQATHPIAKSISISIHMYSSTIRQ
jgi:hypothetical protein